MLGGALASGRVGGGSSDMDGMCDFLWLFLCVGVCVMWCVCHCLWKLVSGEKEDLCKRGLALRHLACCDVKGLHVGRLAHC